MNRLLLEFIATFTLVLCISSGAYLNPGVTIINLIHKKLSFINFIALFGIQIIAVICAVFVYDVLYI